MCRLKKDLMKDLCAGLRKIEGEREFECEKYIYYIIYILYIIYIIYILHVHITYYILHITYQISDIRY